MFDINIVLSIDGYGCVHKNPPPLPKTLSEFASDVYQSLDALIQVKEVAVVYKHYSENDLQMVAFVQTVRKPTQGG